ncbi:MAG: hypothetical protein NZ934_00630 [Hadesarchaea archaeon]|nr:hypothetical protein [Hadesarchaea archaeon]
MPKYPSECYKRRALKSPPPHVSTGGLLTILPRKRRRKRIASDVTRGMLLFLIFLGLSIVVHETSHLLAARALGYEADVHYGVEIPYIYGIVRIDPPSRGLIDTLLIFSAGGLGAGVVFYILWHAIEDIIAKLLLSFFTSSQLAYGAMEPMVALGVLHRAWLGTVPVAVGLVALIAFRLIYWRLGWW